MHTTFDQAFYDDGVWSLEPMKWPELDEDADYPTPLTEWIEEKFYNYEACPYCNTALETSEYFMEEDDLLFEDQGDGPDIARLWSCPYCAYWQWYSTFENRGIHGRAAMSVLGEFEPCVPDGCGSELAQHLRRNQSLWHSINPKGMERLVADLFRANYDCAEVIHVGRPGDLGIDVLFVDSGGKKWLIQVKRRERSKRVEGFEALQRLLGTLALEGELRGVVASNAKYLRRTFLAHVDRGSPNDRRRSREACQISFAEALSHFSRQACRQAERATKWGFIIELLDRGKLNRMLGAMLPEQPWLRFLQDIGLARELQRRFVSSTSVPRGWQPFAP